MSTETLRTALKTPSLSTHTGGRKRIARSTVEAHFTSHENIMRLHALLGHPDINHVYRFVDVVCSQYEPNDVGLLPSDIPERIEQLNLIVLDHFQAERLTDESERRWYNSEILPTSRDFSRPLTELPLADTVFSDHTSMYLTPGVRSTLRMREPVLRPASLGQAPRELSFQRSDRTF
jgi:hypothetical protein